MTAFTLEWAAGVQRRNRPLSTTGARSEPSPAPPAATEVPPKARRERAAFHLLIPGPPVGKGRPRFGRGRTYTPAKTRDAERMIRLLALASGAREFRYAAGDSRLSVTVVFACDTTRGDVDNLGKLLLDALNDVLWADDRVIDALQLNRCWDYDAPHTELWVRTAADVPPRHEKKPRGRPVRAVGGS